MAWCDAINSERQGISQKSFFGHSLYPTVNFIFPFQESSGGFLCGLEVSVEFMDSFIRLYPIVDHKRYSDILGYHSPRYMMCRHLSVCGLKRKFL